MYRVCWVYLVLGIGYNWRVSQIGGIENIQTGAVKGWG